MCTQKSLGGACAQDAQKIGRLYDGCLTHINSLTNINLVCGKQLSAGGEEMRVFNQTSQVAKTKNAATAAQAKRRHEQQVQKQEAAAYNAKEGLVQLIKCYDCGGLISVLPGQVVLCPACQKPNKMPVPKGLQ